MTTCRLITADDAPALAQLLRLNRDFLAPWEPLRSDDFFTEDAQRIAIQNALCEHEQGRNLPLVILDEEASIIGRITLNGIVRGAFQSCSVGYWVSQSRNGRGLASAAVGEVVGLAFRGLGLHRLQAETLLHNTPSQRVLIRNGFRPFAVAPSYLKIAGEWQDHVLFHLLNEPA